MTEIVTCIVFRQALVKAQHLAVARDYFHASHPASGHAIANHFDAARVGRHIAAKLARSRRREIDRIVQTLGFGKLLQLLGYNAGLANHEPIGRVKVEYFIHAIKRNHYLTRGRHSAAAKARAATRGNQRHFHTLCEFDKRDHLVGVSRQHNRNR